METKNTPRDVVMYIATFVTLYGIVIAFITLVFTLIDAKFPDVLNFYYTDPYSGPVRFAIASLIILAPLFVYFMKRIQNDARRNPERSQLPVRKWLTYITLFVAGATVVGDLITLLYSFLGGSLPTPFALKAITLLGVSGAIFWYFVRDIKGYWQTRKEQGTLVSYAFMGTIIASLLLGFYTMGSPATQRELRLDETRRQHLEQIQQQVVMYWQNNGELPKEISALNNPLQYFTLPTDPEIGTAYEYTKTNDLSFELCTTFTHASSQERRGEYYPMSMTGLRDSDNWKHDAGRSCFARTIDTALIKPIMVPGEQAKILPIN